MEAGTRRTWLAPEDRMRRLSVHGKSPEPPYSTASRTSEALSASATKYTPRNKKGKQIESPNTPFDGAEEFSHTTSGAGGSLHSPSEVDSGSQSKKHTAGSARPALTPKAPRDGKAVQDAFPSRVSSAASERETKRATKYHPAGIPIPQRPSSLPAGESRSSPLLSARREKGDKAEGDQQTGADTPLQRGGETKHAGWFQNDTYAAEASAAVPGWKRPSITVPMAGESSHSRRLSSSAAGSSMPWPAISPKEAVTAEQEAWYIEQVAGALSGREHAVETVQALLRSCRAKTVSSVAAMHQVAALLAGHPILIEGFTAFLPDKAAFLQLDDRAGGPAYPLSGFQKGTAPAEGAPLMPGAQPRSASGLASARTGSRGRRARPGAAHGNAAGGGMCGCSCWRYFKAAQSKGWHLPWWTMVFSVASIAVFMYMAGNYGIYHLLQQDLTHPDAATAQSPEDRVAQLGFTPAGLRAWFGAAPGWRSFNGPYLVAWGARYMPDVARGRWWLWATSGLLHTDFMHLAGSLLPWAVLSFLLEVNYGSIRVFLLCLVSLLGAAFTSAVLDPSCQVVVGCNGALMGALPWLFGAFLADFPVISWSWLQLPLAVCAIVLHLIVAILQRDAPHHSNWADMGGFLCGLLPAILFLPCPSDPRWAMAKRLLGNAGKRCMPCHACGCSAPRTASSELAPADTAAADEMPPSEPAMQAAEALRPPSRADDVSLDMQRCYDKHQIPSLGPYDKSLRSQWDIEQPTEPYSRKAGSIAAHRGGTRPAQSPAVQRMEAQPRSTSTHEVSVDVRSSAESLLVTRQALSIDANAAAHEEQSLTESACAREMEDIGCCACCTCANIVHGVFCMFSVVVFLGILVAAPVYLYLVKLPKLACDADV